MAQASAGVLLRIEGSASRKLAAAPIKLRALGATFDLEPLFEVRGKARRVGARRPSEAVWHLARSTRQAAVAASPWDEVREVVARAAAQGLRVSLAEPDLIQSWLPPARGKSKLSLRTGPFQDQDLSSGKVGVDRVFAWHLGDSFSGLRSARLAAANPDATIRIAHLDTGYDLAHQTFPRNRFDAELSLNCTGDGRPLRDVRDLIGGGLVNNPGHGTGTLGILAGERFAFHQSGYDFDDLLGGAPHARIVGIRVANSVVQIKTSAVAKAIAHAAALCDDDASRVHVLSMSMGGVASAAWADAVNQAYEQGIVLVTASGNNFSAGFLGGTPTTSTVYPARFQRVLAACGIMANLRPYYGLSLGTMQGNWGPRSKRATSLAAFTPNTPWARRDDADLVDMDGAGTSSATPQVAATAALYLQRHAGTLFDTNAYAERWQIVEAVRRALFDSAFQPANEDDAKKLGVGFLRAHVAIEQTPVPSTALRMSEPASVSFPFFNVLTGLGLAAKAPDALLHLELAQLVQTWDDAKTANPFDALLDVAESPAGLTREQRRELLERLAAHPRASRATRAELRAALDASAGKGRDKGRDPDSPPPEPSIPPAPPSPTTSPYASATPFTPPRPAVRELRGYALDPSFASALSTSAISETVFRIPWEEVAPGPTDDYLEVIDIDPPADRLYEPIDLNEPHLLAAKGLAPSEGTPQFHQQMVYAVARMTIARFERALGRPALWRPGPPKDPKKNPFDDSTFVPRLRVYPHALREANAYYSPDKIALLFGYFTSEPADDGAPTEQVFTCLSHDIIAHETTHALLDGMHRRYLTDSNPDVLAFHEAFADIVSLFQRITLPDLLRFEIGQTQGKVRTRRSLLGQLATQFGRAIGQRGALREAIGRIDERTGEWAPSEPSPADYESALEPHDRGSILVAAVFDAFMSIYEKRTEDLVRLATDGTGILPPGAIHPDLVNRLADEAAKAASHVLSICIRALDYTPPTDITFGEYLRALITADMDLVPDDDRGYRVAFLEAFKKRGITAPGVRSMSVDSLRWRRADDGAEALSPKLRERLRDLRAFANAEALDRRGDERAIAFQRQRAARAQIHTMLSQHIRSGATGKADARFLGLNPDLPFEVHTARFAMRVAPDGRLQSQAILGFLQRDPLRRADNTPFEGGSTVLADLSTRQVQYVIRKNIMSDSRLAAQRRFAARAARDRSTYFRADDAEPFAGLHRSKGGC